MKHAQSSELTENVSRIVRILLARDDLNQNDLNTETAKVARFTRTLNEVPQITFANGIVNDANLLPEGMNTIAQAIAHGWVKTSDGRWIK